jgi:HAD superfamily hydrolase (TIGR01484 family)
MAVNGDSVVTDMMKSPAAPGVDQAQDRAEPARRAAADCRPWAEVDPLRLASVQGVFTDIDDTLTADGNLHPDAALGLDLLRAAGVPVVAITGRPVGWSRPFAKAWPLAALVAENGSVALLPDATTPGGLHTEYSQDAPTRAANAQRLQQVLLRIEAEVPGARRATDSAGRETDIAIDHSEFHHLPEAAIAQVVALMQAEGLNATVSSIHINGWFGAHTKLTAAHWMLTRLFGHSAAAARTALQRWLYVGDSTNDQRMFGAVPLSVGVANLQRFATQLHTWPAYLTTGERGTGFLQVAQALLKARQAP